MTRRTVVVVLAVPLALASLRPSAPAAAQDLRIPVVERMIADDPGGALEAARAARARDPEEAARVGISYLRGRLLQELGRFAEAEEAFASALGETPELRPYVRYHLALAQEREGHPEVAAGLIASVVVEESSPVLLARATELFGRSIEGGGDCRILRGVRRHRRLPARQDRLLRVVDGQCALRRGDRLEAAAGLCELMQESREDDAARRAADLLEQLGRRDPDLRAALKRRGCDLELEIGMALHHHREYDRSIPFLERALAHLPRRRIVADDREFEARYALARGYFWREELTIAAQRFSELALRARDLEERSRVLYQEGRCLELLGDWNGADAVFRRTYMTLQDGRFAAPALFSALRLEWRGGRERDALDLYRLLSSHRDAGRYAARAALFLAASDLVRGRTDRAGTWLDDAERFDRDAWLEAAYWRGRSAQLEGEGAAAVDHYLDVATEDPYHPLALDAVERLRSGELVALAMDEAGRRARTGRPDGLFAAWIVGGEGRIEGREARRALLERLASSSPTAPFLALEAVPVEDWPLWRSTLTDGPEMLLALGLVDEGAAAVGDHFPANRPALAFTGSRLLRDAGEVRRSMLLADVAIRPLTRRLQDPLLPEQIRTLLYPLPWREQIMEQARSFGVDPLLLAAVIRQESRFDPEAVSAVSARGLGQFVWLTAKRLAAQAGMGRIVPGDLYDPELSITLGATYLGELVGRFDGLEHEAVAAYNAGPAQAHLWQTYCFGRGTPEYFTKTSFGQTRGYLRKVLGSRAQYAELYGAPGS